MIHIIIPLFCSSPHIILYNYIKLSSIFIENRSSCNNNNLMRLIYDIDSVGQPALIIGQHVPPSTAAPFVSSAISPSPTSWRVEGYFCSLSVPCYAYNYAQTELLLLLLRCASLFFLDMMIARVHPLLSAPREFRVRFHYSCMFSLACFPVYFSSIILD